jgi:hypothetical protein
MERLIDVMRAWSQAGLPRVLRIPIAITIAELAPGYSLQRWRNDPQADRDQRLLFRLYVTRTPELADVLDEIRGLGDVSEMRCEGQDAQGLLAAWLLDGLAVSWNSHPVWGESGIPCLLSELGSAGDVFQRDVNVAHASSPAHLDSWLAARRSERESQLAHGRAILEKSGEWLPSLRFVGSALEQVAEWTPNREGWPFVVRSLCQLQDLCSAWGAHPFPHAGISSPCSPESSRVDTNDVLRSQREFVCEDGELRYFTWHIKHYKLNLRIHYHADQQERIVRIAYLGIHLPL